MELSSTDGEIKFVDSGWEIVDKGLIGFDKILSIVNTSNTDEYFQFKRFENFSISTVGLLITADNLTTTSLFLSSTEADNSLVSANGDLEITSTDSIDIIANNDNIFLSTGSLFSINAAKGIRLPKLSSDPTDNLEAVLYYNTTDDKFKYRDDSTWQTIATQSWVNSNFYTQSYINSNFYTQSYIDSNFYSKNASYVDLPQGTSDPTGTPNGSMYYNTSTNRVRVNINGTWANVNTSL